MFSWFYSSFIDPYTLKITLYLSFGFIFLILALYKKKVSKLILGPLLVVLFIIIHSFLFALDTETSLQDSFLLLTAICCAYSLLLSEVVIISHVKIAMRILLYIILITSIPLIIIGGGYKAGNFNGVFFNSNYLGLIISVICFPIILDDIKNNKRFLSIIVALISLYVLFETRSRTSLVSVIVCILLYSIMHKDIAIGKVKLAFISIAALFSIFIFLFLFGNKYEGQDSILSTRAPMLEQRFSAIESKPFVGWGYGSDTSPIFAKSVYQIFPRLEKGNVYLAMLEEFGLLLGVGILIYIIYMSYKYFTNENLDISLRLFFPLALISSLGETWFFNPNGWLTFVYWFFFIYAAKSVNRGQGL